MNSSTSGGAVSRSIAAFLRRIAIRVSRSGGWTSVIRPHSNRLRSRSSSASSRLGGAVGGEHDLLVGVVEGVEGVEELLLGLGLALQELDVVDQQHVDVAVAPLEPVLPVVADRVDELVGELLAGHVAHLGAGVEAADVVADRVQQVGLAQPGVAVDEQRVVGLAGRLGDGDGGGVREPVGRADDEGLEGVLRVEAGLERRWARGPGASTGVAGGGGAVVDDRASTDLSTCRLSRLVDSSIVVVARRRRVVLERGVDGDRDPDLAAEARR